MRVIKNSIILRLILISCVSLFFYTTFSLALPSKTNTPTVSGSSGSTEIEASASLGLGIPIPILPKCLTAGIACGQSTNLNPPQPGSNEHKIACGLCCTLKHKIPPYIDGKINPQFVCCGDVCFGMGASTSVGQF